MPRASKAEGVRDDAVEAVPVHGELAQGDERARAAGNRAQVVAPALELAFAEALGRGLVRGDGAQRGAARAVDAGRG